MKILSVLGARPQFIKASALTRAIKRNPDWRIEEMLVHTGQHYDQEMSGIFFQELSIPTPGYELGIGSHSHGKQTGLMIEGVSDAIRKEKPQCVLVYGDTNSTLAGALAGMLNKIPVVHVEAGLRSFNHEMPEEINRTVADYFSALLFCPTKTAINNLRDEGFPINNVPDFNLANPGVFLSGDVMFDNTLYFSGLPDEPSKAGSSIEIPKDGFLLATIHRNTNTDNPEKLFGIFSGLNELSKDSELECLLPLHPRTRKMIFENASLGKLISGNPKLRIVPPVSFLTMNHMIANANLVLTDSGGVQKEAYFLRKPCLVLREETEWVELISTNTCKLSGANPDLIKTLGAKLMTERNLEYPPLFGDGKAAEFILQRMLESFS